MKRIHWLAIGPVLIALGCSSASGPITKNEPTGLVIALTQADQDNVRWAYDDMKLWAAWHNKGTHLLSTRDGGNPGPQEYDQALYCFHQALSAWPKKLADTEPEARRNRHTAEASDTLLQLGWLYLKRNEPKFALAYFKRAETYLPGSHLVSKGIADAEEMQKASGK